MRHMDDALALFSAATLSGALVVLVLANLWLISNRHEAQATERARCDRVLVEAQRRDKKAFAKVVLRADPCETVKEMRP